MYSIYSYVLYRECVGSHPLLVKYNGLVVARVQILVVSSTTITDIKEAKFSLIHFLILPITPSFDGIWKYNYSDREGGTGEGLLNLPYCDFTFLTLEIGVHILINRITTSGASIINLQFYPGVDYLTPPPPKKKKKWEKLKNLMFFAKSFTSSKWMEKYFWECGMGVINLDLIENPMVIKNIVVKGSNHSKM